MAGTATAPRGGARVTRTRLAAALLFALALAAPLATAAAACPPRDCPPPRRAVTVNLAEGGTFDLCLPRYLPPEATRTNLPGTARYVRTYNDTCGLYGITATKAPANAGPGPHYHLADDEWFIPLGDADHARAFLPVDDATPLRAGQLPGVNVPAARWGSVALPPRTLAHSPPGVVHTWRTDTAVEEFLAVWGYGFAMEDIVGMARAAGDVSALDAEQLLLQSSLHGVPSTPQAGANGTGLFVGTDDWPALRAPPRLFPSEVERLQALFDAGEACYPTAA